MKSLVQTVVLLAVLGGLIFGITFGLQYTLSPEHAKPISTGDGKKSEPSELGHQLTFPGKVGTTVVIEHQIGVDGEFELGSQGHQDFLFWNAESAPLYTWLDEKNCVCVSRVELCQLTPEETRRFWARTLAAHVPTAALLVQPVLGNYPAGFVRHVWDALLLDRIATESKATWQPFELRGAPLTVQPQTVGLVRFHWKGERSGPIRLAVDLSHQLAEKNPGPRAKNRLEIALAFVPAARIHPEQFDMEDLNPRAIREKEFVVWSATRPHFKLEPKADTQHPCYELTLRPLTDDDRAKWQPTLPSKSRMLSGYVVHLKVHERRSDKEQLDLGPIRRRLEFIAEGVKDPLVVGLTGLVRGEITLADSPDSDRLAMENFGVKEGKTRTFVLQSDQPGTELAKEIHVEPASLSFLKVELGKPEPSGGGRTQWKLTLTVPPGRLAGRFPRDSAIILKIQGDPPRRVRIPITGTAINF